MMKQINNLDQIVSIKIQKEWEVNWYTWKPKSWFNWTEGFYGKFEYDRLTDKELEKYIVKDKTLYNKPRVVITFTNDDTIVLIGDDMRSVEADYKRVCEMVKDLNFDTIR